MKLESWCSGVIQKHKADGVRVCCDLLEAGLRRGYVTANDIRDVYFSEPNVIGGIFKSCMRGCGFTKTKETEKAQAKKKHGRDLPIWILINSNMARQALNKLAGHLIAVGNDQPELF